MRVKPIEQIKEAIGAFEAIAWASCGGPDRSEPRSADCGWVKFQIEKSELGWRTLEFIAWVCSDMARAGERLQFFPTPRHPISTSQAIA